MDQFPNIEDWGADTSIHNIQYLGEGSTQNIVKQGRIYFYFNKIIK